MLISGSLLGPPLRNPRAARRGRDGGGVPGSGFEARPACRDIQGIEEAKPRAISPEGYRAFDRCVAPDGKSVAVSGPDQRHYLYPVEGGEPSAIPGLVAGDIPVSWSADGHSLLIGRRGEVPMRAVWLDLQTGHKELWRELMPPDPAGISTIGRVAATPNGKSYAYSYTRSLADLYVIDGLK